MSPFGDKILPHGAGTHSRSSLRRGATRARIHPKANNYSLLELTEVGSSNVPASAPDTLNPPKSQFGQRLVQRPLTAMASTAADRRSLALECSNWPERRPLTAMNPPDCVIRVCPRSAPFWLSEPTPIPDSPALSISTLTGSWPRLNARFDFRPNIKKGLK
jgi:hypothetical protein